MRTKRHPKRFIFGWRTWRDWNGGNCDAKSQQERERSLKCWGQSVYVSVHCVIILKRGAARFMQTATPRRPPGGVNARWHLIPKEQRRALFVTELLLSPASFSGAHFSARRIRWFAVTRERVTDCRTEKTNPRVRFARVETEASNWL